MRFAGRVSAANYIAAGQNAAADSATFIKTARDNAPSYEDQSKQAIQQSAANFEAAARNAAAVTNAGIRAVGTVKEAKRDIKTREAEVDSKRFAGKMAAVGAGAIKLGQMLKKDVEEPEYQQSKEPYEARLTELDEGIAADRARLTEIESRVYTPPAKKVEEGGTLEQGSKVQAMPAGDTGLQLMSDLVSDGYTPVQAAAIAGNAQYESANFTAHEEFEPNAYGTRGAGFFQWTNAGGSNRRTNFENYAKAHNLDPKSYAASSRFAIHEMKGGAGNHWTGGMTDRSFRQIEDLDTAVTSFQSNYLRPNPQVANTPQRLANAQALLKRYQNQ